MCRIGMGCKVIGQNNLVANLEHTISYEAIESTCREESSTVHRSEPPR